MVFTDATLQLIAEHDARSPARRCCKISGVGRTKLEKYGEDVLDAGRLTLAGPGWQKIFEK